MSTTTRGKLSGEYSKELQGQLNKLNKKDKLMKLFRFFNHQDGDLEFWNMVSIMTDQVPLEEADNSRVLHIKDISPAY
jgi:hypothetical protein